MKKVMPFIMSLVPLLLIVLFTFPHSSDRSHKPPSNNSDSVLFCSLQGSKDCQWKEEQGTRQVLVNNGLLLPSHTTITSTTENITKPGFDAVQRHTRRSPEQTTFAFKLKPIFHYWQTVTVNILL